MTAIEPTRAYDVHLFAVVRIKVPNVHATTPRAAIEMARDQVVDLYARFESADSEFAEEFSHYLVDVVGDEEYDESQFFDSAEQPHLAVLRQLVDLYDAGSPPEQIAELIAEVRQILRDAVLIQFSAPH